MRSRCPRWAPPWTCLDRSGRGEVGRVPRTGQSRVLGEAKRSRGWNGGARRRWTARSTTRAGVIVGCGSEGWESGGFGSRRRAPVGRVCAFGKCGERRASLDNARGWFLGISEQEVYILLCIFSVKSSSLVIIFVVINEQTVRIRQTNKSIVFTTGSAAKMRVPCVASRPSTVTAARWARRASTSSWARAAASSGAGATRR